MYVVRVMPVTRGVMKGELSFFAKEAIEPGLIMTVTVRGRPVPALVLESTEAREAKATLKKQSFALKRASVAGARRIFSPTIVRAAEAAAHYYATSTGAVLAHFSPPSILASTRAAAPSTSTRSDDAQADLLVLQAEEEERVSAYRNTAREAFARGGSVMIVAATVPEAESLAEKLSRGIEAQVVLLTGSLSKKALLTSWNRAVEDTQPLLIIATTQFLTLPLAKVETMIVERESARAYVGRERGAMDARIMAEEVARATGTRLILADFPMRVETRRRLYLHEVEEAARLQVAVRSGARVRIIDVKRKKDDLEELKPKKRFSPISEYAARTIADELVRGGRVAVYAARRGIAPLTVCNDCGTPVTDPATGAPMTLEKTTEGNIFISYRSGAMLPAETKCRRCESWNLVSLGVGVERVHDEVRNLFPEAPLFSLTAESAPTHAKARDIKKRFFDSAGAIMVGTDRMIPFLEKVERTLVTSADAMLATSAWRAEEHALHTLFALRDTTETELMIQTREPDSRVMRALASGNPTEFFETELTERERFGYPPFSTFVGLTWVGTADAVKKTGALVTERLKAWDLVGPLPAQALEKNRYRARAVVRLPEDGWPDDAVRAALAALPPDIVVTIDPDEIV